MVKKKTKAKRKVAKVKRKPARKVVAAKKKTAKKAGGKRKSGLTQMTNPDKKLAEVLGSRPLDMLKLAGHISKHLSK
jgi:hypothetical protein